VLSFKANLSTFSLIWYLSLSSFLGTHNLATNALRILLVDKAGSNWHAT
jgi:hypothetical protein